MEIVQVTAYAGTQRKVMPDMSIEQVKQVPILDVARRLGIAVVDSKACCFIHDDKTPSLSFNEGGNYFKCFGCGAGGSVIDLVKLYLDTGTGEAIRWIEREYGIGENLGPAIDFRTNDPLYGKTGKTQPRPAIHGTGQSGKQDGRAYSHLYRELLELGDEQAALDYLAGRGITADIARPHGIRVVDPAAAQALTDRHDMDDLLQSGLFARSKKTGRPYYALFAHRLVIPYLDRDGETVLTLQGRDMDGSSNHKYQLLPGIETALYNLRALDGAKTVYLCEGALDVLSALQLGLSAPVGIAGVSNFKAGHYELLDPYKVIIAADADGAGKAFYRKLRGDLRARGKDAQVLDWDKLKADYGLPDGAQVKDLNDIAKLADYDHKRKAEPKRIYSHLFGEIYTMTADGVDFDSGVRYGWDELDLIRERSEKTLKAVHEVKRTFNGRVIA